MVQAVEKTPVTLSDEFKRNPELKQDDINALRNWCKMQPHLPHISDEYLALFLHSCYFRIEAAKSAIDSFYTIRTHVPEFFSNRDPERVNIKMGTHVGRFVILPNKTPEGYRVMTTSLGLTDSAVFNFNDSAKAFLMTLDLAHYYEGSWNGFIICFDMKGTTFGHVARIPLMSLKKAVVYLQEAMPVRLKGLHFINVNPALDKILSMIKPFMKKEVQDLIFLHTTLESAYKIIPKDIMPKDYAGDAALLEELMGETDKFRKDHKQWFEDEEKARVIESKRPGKSKNAGDLFGIEGSFKKLDLD